MALLLLSLAWPSFAGFPNSGIGAHPDSSNGALLPVGALLPSDEPLATGGSTHASTIVVDTGLQRVWNVNPDNDTVTAIDARKLVKLFESKVGANPRTLALAPGGAVWVVNQDDATVSILDSADGRVRKSLRLPYASRPYGIAFSPRGDTAYVTLQALGRLLKIDARSGAILDAVDVGPTPRGIAVSADGKRILATRFISPADRGEVTEVDAASFAVSRSFQLAVDPGPDSPVSGRGVPNSLASIVIAPNGQRAWIASKKDNTGRGLHVSGEPLSFEATTRTIVSQLDLVKNREVLAARRDIDNRAMAVAIEFDPRGEFAFIALQGANAVDVLDAVSGMPVASIPDTGFAPQGLVADGSGRLFVQNFLSRDVAVFDISDLERGARIRLLRRIRTTAREVLEPPVLLGKQVFYNAADVRMSRDGYVSCASCHLEGGGDGRVWDFSGRGAHGGGLRNTKTLFGRSGLGHGPIHWRADMDEIQDFEILLRQTLQGRGFVSDAVFHAKGANWVFGSPNAGLSRELDALAAFVTSFDAVNPSPYRLPGGLMTADALAGEAIFHSPVTECSSCHASPRFTDSSLRPRNDTAGDSAQEADAGMGGHNLPFRMHDVGTLTEAAGDFQANALRALDTPTVKGVWETPPYLHDGSAATLMEVISTRNARDRHGRTSHLPPAHMAQLVAYLNQLDDTPVDTSATITYGAGKRPSPGSKLDRQSNLLHFAVHAGARGGIRIAGVTLKSSGDPGHNEPLVARVHADGNGNGRVDPSEPLLAESALVPGDPTALLPLRPAPIVRAGAAVSLVATLVAKSVEGALEAPSAPGGNAYGIDLIEVEAAGLTSGNPSAIVGLPRYPATGNQSPAP